MADKEILIDIKANAEPFKKTLKDIINNTNMSTASMSKFTAIIENANKIQLKNISKDLSGHIKEATKNTKLLQQDLLKAQKIGDWRGQLGITNALKESQLDIIGLQAKLSKVSKMPILTTPNVSMVKFKEHLEATKKKMSEFTNRVGRMVSRMALMSIIAPIFSTIRKGFSDAVAGSDKATNSFGALANAFAGSLIPIVETFVNVIRKAFIWIAGLLNYLFGFNMIQKGIELTSKKIADVGSSAKQAGKDIKKGLLSNMDEITNIDTGDTGSSRWSVGEELLLMLVKEH